MKTNIYAIIAASALAMGLASCNDDTWQPKLEKEGELRLSSMTVDIDTRETLSSRAGESIDLSQFIIEIANGQTVVSTWTYEKMPEIITLPVGEYTARVYSHRVQKQDWDKPYFLGSKDFQIANDKITDLGTVTCTFQSIKVTVVFADELRKHLGDDCQVTVKANDDGALVYGLNETRAGYFEAVSNSTTLVASFSGTIDGLMVNADRTYTDVAPGTHYRITFSMQNNEPEYPDEYGNLDITGQAVGSAGISIDTSVTDVNNGGSITIDEDLIVNPGERPGKEEPLTPDVPDTPGDPSAESITFETSAGLDLNAYNSVEIEKAVVKLHSDNGFAHLNVKIESDNDDFIASAGALLPMEFDLVTVTGDTREGLESLGLPVEFAGKTDVDFDISSLVPLLAGFPGKHVFHLTVEDPQGANRSIELKFIAE